jgi:hypothetical protein
MSAGDAEQALEQELGPEADRPGELTGATESASVADGSREAAESLSWLDESLRELEGALEACGKAIDAGTLPAEAVSGRMNALVQKMLGQAG